MVQISGATKLLGVMGYPIEHSLSPVMHNAALSALATQQAQAFLEYVYIPWPVTAEALPTVVSGLKDLGCLGFNITIPHKQAIIPLLAETTAIAQTVGAVNTVWLTDAGWVGTNTDVQGFLSPLQSLNRDWPHITPCILGCGGAARAVLAGCAQLGCPHAHVIGRQNAKLEQLRKSCANTLSIEIHTHLWQKLSHFLPQTDLLINTTPVGMSPHTQASPLSVAEVHLLPADAIVYDLIYNPNPTLLLQATAASGRTAITGVEMLVQQGAAALSLWINQPAPVEVMRQALLACF
ncbi:shikimate dehydrogenase [Acaryochloris sp. IP29b_bin.137]|uniref:shikimate dehydrogenase n=1 Tax=Acaryochloris sp. IP29b_bin.137 TaxID=2969217 RepID=UPI00261041C0|nr:shikimate dehydrogenase [Acaryochloris sp. IP29b_bin.137]